MEASIPDKLHRYGATDLAGGDESHASAKRDAGHALNARHKSEFRNHIASPILNEDSAIRLNRLRVIHKWGKELPGAAHQGGRSYRRTIPAKTKISPARLPPQTDLRKCGRCQTPLSEHCPHPR